jgi:hypothetical protein
MHGWSPFRQTETLILAHDVAIRVLPPVCRFSFWCFTPTIPLCNRHVATLRINLGLVFAAAAAEMATV